MEKLIMQEFIQQLTREAGDLAMKHYGNAKIAVTKSHKEDYATDADLEVNQFVIDAIQKAYPDHIIISEEDDKVTGTGEYTWIVDPIDGTRNFFKGIPLWGSMIALAKGDEVIMACVYDPNANELLFAEKGKGAFLNGKQIYSSTKSELGHSRGHFGAWLTATRLKIFQEIRKRTKEDSIQVTTIGSAAITTLYLATGRTDWSIITKGGKVWDHAPIALICEEAGSKVTDFEGNAWTMENPAFIVAPEALYSTVLEIAQSI